MFNYQPFDSQEEAFEEIITLPDPTIKKIEEAETYGKYSIEPFAKGFGITLANPLRIPISSPKTRPAALPTCSPVTGATGFNRS